MNINWQFLFRFHTTAPNNVYIVKFMTQIPKCLRHITLVEYRMSRLHSSLETIRNYQIPNAYYIFIPITNFVLKKKKLISRMFPDFAYYPGQHPLLLGYPIPQLHQWLDPNFANAFSAEYVSNHLMAFGNPLATPGPHFGLHNGYSQYPTAAFAGNYHLHSHIHRIVYVYLPWWYRDGVHQRGFNFERRIPITASTF